MWGWIGPTQLVNQSLTGLNFHSGQLLNPFESRLDGRLVALWSLVEEKPNRKNSLSTFLAPVKWLSKKIVRKQIPIS